MVISDTSAMLQIFPKIIQDLPEVDIPLDGVRGYLVQGDASQVIFVEFEKDVEMPEHDHKDQWEIVLEGKVDYFSKDQKHTYVKGDRFFVPCGLRHSAKIYSGYAAIMFFNEKHRYKEK